MQEAAATGKKLRVMHKGQMRETGAHQDLLAQRDLYWRLYQLQFYQDYRRTFAESVADDQIGC